ncbi:MAG: 30S ribosomal protein S3 [bacterium]
MGQKVHPVGLRLGIIKTWDSRWFAKKEYSKFLHEDLNIRKYVHNKLKNAGVSKVEIERASDRVKVNIYSARPGIIIGKKGTEVDKLKNDIQKMINKQIFINIMEIRKSEIDAQLVAENIAVQLEKRVAFRRAMKKRVSMARRFGADGIKIACAGRLGAAEMARREWYREGRVPLHTLRADIDYGFSVSKTTYGTIGVKVWIFKGEFSKEETKESKDITLE